MKGHIPHFEWLMCMGLLESAQTVNPIRKLPDLTVCSALGWYLIELRIHAALVQELTAEIDHEILKALQG